MDHHDCKYECIYIIHTKKNMYIDRKKIRMLVYTFDHTQSFTGVYIYIYIYIRNLAENGTSWRDLHSNKFNASENKEIVNHFATE